MGRLQGIGVRVQTRTAARTIPFRVDVARTAPGLLPIRLLGQIRQRHCTER